MLAGLLLQRGVPHYGGAVCEPVGPRGAAQPAGVFREVQRDGQPAGQLRREQVQVRLRLRVQEMLH